MLITQRIEPDSTQPAPRNWPAWPCFGMHQPRPPNDTNPNSIIPAPHTTRRRLIYPTAFAMQWTLPP